MTTLKYHRDSDTFEVNNSGRIAVLAHNAFYARLTDSDLLDTAQKAKQCAGDAVVVPSTSNARGLRPKSAQRLGVIQ